LGTVKRRRPAGTTGRTFFPGASSETSRRVGHVSDERGSSQMSVTKVIEVVGRSTESSDSAVKNALVEAGRNLRDIKALDVVSIGLRGESLNEWGALVRISFLVDNVND